MANSKPVLTLPTDEAEYLENLYRYYTAGAHGK